MSSFLRKPRAVAGLAGAAISFAVRTGRVEEDTVVRVQDGVRCQDRELLDELLVLPPTMPSGDWTAFVIECLSDPQLHRPLYRPGLTHHVLSPSRSRGPGKFQGEF